MSPFTRRQTLKALGAAGAGLLVYGRGLDDLRLADADAATATATAAACTLTPEQEEGPFYVDVGKVRRDITGGRPGVPLHLRIKLVETATCEPLAGAAVDIWHCDATGEYSDESSQGTSGQTWLRGIQFTNAKGIAQFTTIYPGFYEGRATHIHLKVHLDSKSGHVAHTGQMFFSDAMSSQVYRRSPYTKDTNQRTLHGSDRVWTQQHGSSSVLALSKRGSSLARDGLLGTITLGVDTSA
jgi:protocatechuate 3,4-dioxygenase beta subunit